MNELIEKEHDYIYQTYKRLPIVASHAEGVRVYGEDGTVYLDFLGGIAVNVLGHSHPKVILAIERQIHKYMHLSNYFYQQPQIKLAEMLCHATGMKKVFFTNSGAEATEGAIKLVRRWGANHGKNTIIGFSGGFHGRTYGALSIMDKPLYKDKMGPFLADTKVIEYNAIEALESNIDANTAGVFLEFLQGEGGLTEVTPEFITALENLRQKYGFLIVADEIQSGMGRTGKFSAYEHFGIIPDIITVAKGIGGGLPLGAILAGDKTEHIWQKGQHGTTFGGNAVSCAVGEVVMRELEHGLLEHVNEIGNYLKNELIKLQSEFPSKISEIRGRGLMLGIVMNEDATELLYNLLDLGVIANVTSGKVLRLVPPYIIQKADVDEFIGKLREALQER